MFTRPLRNLVYAIIPSWSFVQPANQARAEIVHRAVSQQMDHQLRHMKNRLVLTL